MKCKTGRYRDRGVRGGIAVFLISILTAGSVSAAGENNVHLYGSLVAEPCVIPPGKGDIMLDFSSLTDEYLYQHTRTPGWQFEIHLAECDLSVGSAVKVTFLGPENPVLAGMLAIDGGSEASGIAIGLETGEGKPLPINKAIPQVMLQPGSNVIALKAYVQGEPQAITGRAITRGMYRAVATFSLEYE